MRLCGWQTTLRLTLDNVVRLDSLKPLIESFYQTFDFAELQVNMEVFNGSWEAIAQERADIVLSAQRLQYRSVVILKCVIWDYRLGFHYVSIHPCALQSDLSESFVCQFPAICLDDARLHH